MVTQITELALGVSGVHTYIKITNKQSFKDSQTCAVRLMNIYLIDSLEHKLSISDVDKLVM